MAALRFALRNLRRDLRSGELAVLLLALLVAVGSLTAVGFFTDRCRNFKAFWGALARMSKAST